MTAEEKTEEEETEQAEEKPEPQLQPAPKTRPVEIPAKDEPEKKIDVTLQPDEKCPNCNGELATDPDLDVLVCLACGKTYVRE